MDSNITRAFKKASYLPENNLSKSIFLTLSLKEKRNNQIKLWIYSITGILSISGFFLMFKQLISDFSNSGFYDYLALLFSNSKALFYWKEIVLSLTESLPITNIAITLVLVFIFILSLRFMSHNIRLRNKLLIA